MQRTRFKVVGMGLLVIVAIMAVNASAASALKYQLKKNGANVSTLNLVGNGLLVTINNESGVELHCTGSTVNATLETLGGGATLDGAVHILLEGCTVPEAPDCTIHADLNGTVGPSGKILLQGSATATQMKGEDTLLLAESSSLAKFYILGEFCPFEMLYELPGSITLLILTGETNAANHLVDVDDDELFFGEYRAELTGGLTHMQNLTSGATWEIDLVP